MGNVFKGVVVLSKEKYNKLPKKEENTLYVTSTFIESVNLDKLKILSVRKANVLPNESIAKENTLYLIPNPNNIDIFDIYILIDSRWEYIGTTKIDLADYYTKDEVQDLLASIKSLKNVSELKNDMGYITSNVKETLVVNPSIDDENSITIQTNGIIVSSSGLSAMDKNFDNQVIIRAKEDGSITISHKDNSMNSLKEDYIVKIDGGRIYHNGEELITRREVENMIYDLKRQLGLA